MTNTDFLGKAMSDDSNCKDEMKRFFLDINSSEHVLENLSHAIKMQKIGELMATICHEIINPITIINGKLQVIQEICTSTDELNYEILENIKSIRAANTRIHAITNSVLKASFNGVSKNNISNFKDTLAIVLDVMGQELKNSKINVVQRMETDIGILKIDQGELIQILINLISNSIDAIKSSCVSGSGQIIIKQSVYKKHMRITIQDNGCGISDIHGTKIFEPFFTTKESGKGLGLGLSIVSKIISKNGGKIKFNPADNDGVVFKVYLPFKSVPIAQSL
jgi:two-component system NtrC family sensor kinase